LGATAILVLIVLYLFASQSVARRAAEAYRDELMQRFGQPVLEEKELVPIWDTMVVVSLPAELRDFITGPLVLPEPMRMLPSGHARVAWQCEHLAGRGSSNLWPELRVALNKRESGIRVLIDCLDPDSDKDERAREQARQVIWAGGRWLGASVIGRLSEGDVDTAFERLVALLKCRQVDDSGYYYRSLMNTEFPVVWEFLQSTNLNESVLKELAELAGESPPIEHFDSYFRARAAIEIVEMGMIRRDEHDWLESMLGAARTSGRISGWSDFFNSLVDDPRAAFQWLGSRGRKMKYLWRDTYLDEVWGLEDLAIDWEGIRLGLRTNAMNEGLAWARAARKAHGLPGAHLLVSSRSAPLSGAGSLAADDHLHLLTHMAGAEIQHRLMLTAIALHRYRLAEGRFPNDLNALVPRYLKEVPTDLMDGKPLRYELEEGGRFRLWSIGCYDGDNGGDGAPHSTGAAAMFSMWGSLRWIGARDWIWPQPADVKEVAADAAAVISGGVATSLSTASP